MDGAILVVAATDGTMPQTKEHLLLANQVCGIKNWPFRHHNTTLSPVLVILALLNLFGSDSTTSIKLHLSFPPPPPLFCTKVTSFLSSRLA